VQLAIIMTHAFGMIDYDKFPTIEGDPHVFEPVSAYYIATRQVFPGL